MKETFAPADITVYHVKKKVKIEETSYLAYEFTTGKVLAIGKEASALQNNGERVKCVSPFHQGRVDDFNIARVFFKLLFKRCFQGSVLKPTLAFCVPKCTEKIQLTAYEQLLLDAGARRVEIFEGLTLEEFLEKYSEEELKKYTGVIVISKENVQEYAEELLEETYEVLKDWGISKERMVELLLAVEKRKREASE